MDGIIEFGEQVLGAEFHGAVHDAIKGELFCLMEEGRITGDEYSDLVSDIPRWGSKQTSFDIPDSLLFVHFENEYK